MQFELPCRQCWQCNEARINDWVGRCIAEVETSEAAHAITLTYAPLEDGTDPPGAKVLDYSDVQKYLKRLRKSGYVFRYIVCGEYGTEKGRAHWHIVIFWQKRRTAPFDEVVPKHDLSMNFKEEHWPHGFSFWEPADHKCIRYVCKYITKREGDAAAQSEVRMSRFPPLGNDYFVGLAGEYVKQGLAPQSAEYSFRDIKGSDGKPLRFFLSRVSLDNFCASYLAQWREANPGVKHPPESPLTEAYADRIASLAEFWQAYAKYGRRRVPAPELPEYFTWEDRKAARLFIDEKRNAWCLIDPSNGEVLVYNYTADGVEGWRNVNEGKMQSHQSAARIRNDGDPIQYIKARDGEMTP